MESYLVSTMYGQNPNTTLFRKGQCNFQEQISGVSNLALGALFQHQLNTPGPANKGLQDQ